MAEAGWLAQPAGSFGWLLYPGVFPWLASVFGLCVGSFLNMVIPRLRNMMVRAGQDAGAALFIWFTISLAFIDQETGFLPDDLTLPLVWLGLIFNLFNTFTSLQAAVIGAVAGYMSLWLVFWAFKLVTGKEGMGYGDFK